MFIDMAYISVQLDTYPAIFVKFTNVLITLPPEEREILANSKPIKGNTGLSSDQLGLATDRGSHIFLGSDMHGFPIWETWTHTHHWRARILSRLGSLSWPQSHNSISQAQLLEEFPRIGYLQILTAQRSHRRIFALLLRSSAKKRLEETWRLWQSSQVQGIHFSCLRTAPIVAQWSSYSWHRIEHPRSSLSKKDTCTNGHFRHYLQSLILCSSSERSTIWLPNLPTSLATGTSARPHIFSDLCITRSSSSPDPSQKPDIAKQDIHSRLPKPASCYTPQANHFASHMA